MKQRILLPLLLLISGAQGQNNSDTVVLKHKYFTSVFVTSTHIPALVEYYVTSSMLDCDEHLKRGKFAKDPKLPEETNLDKDYANSGYDRGHNMSAKDNDCYEVAMQECFYFSNMFPQTHKLNAGAWYALEKAERDYAIEHKKIKVFIGSFGKKETIGSKHKVRVPKECWKVIYFPDTKTYECYIFPNDEAEQKDFEDYQVKLSEIEKKSRMKFKADRIKISGTINQYKK